MKLGVREAADLLEVSDKTIYRWIHESKIPAYKVNEQYRFNRAELLEWATANKISVSPAIFAEPETVGGAPLPTLVEAIRAGQVVYRVGGNDKASVLLAVVELMPLPDEVDRDFLYQVLLARETLGSTGVGGGIAIPHVRNPVVLHVAKPTVTLCFLEHPIDFKAIDGQKVDTLFTMISPTVQAHLHLLSRLGFVLHKPAFRAALKRQASRDELMAALALAESAIPTAKPTPDHALRT